MMFNETFKKTILVTGSEGFVGKNLINALNSSHNINVLKFGRGSSIGLLKAFVEKADIVIHLAGVNRPKRDEDFLKVNAKLTEALCKIIRVKYEEYGEHSPIILASSIQSSSNNSYGLASA